MLASITAGAVLPQSSCLMQELDRLALKNQESLKKDKESIDRASSQYRQDEQERQQQLRTHHRSMKEEADKQLSLYRYDFNIVCSVSSSTAANSCLVQREAGQKDAPQARR